MINILWFCEMIAFFHLLFCMYFVLIDINRNYACGSGEDYARTLLAELRNWLSLLKTSCFKVNTHHPSWVVDQDICVHEWHFNGKRVLQKCHFSIPLLDAIQIASGPTIPKETFTRPQVAQHLIQKGKRRIKFVCISKARSSYAADAASWCAGDSAGLGKPLCFV